MRTDCKIKFDVVWLHCLWRETDNRLNTYAGRVREGVEVLPAADFPRWVQSSGLIELLEANPVDVPLCVDGKGIRAKVKQLIYDCGEWFRLHEASNIPRDPLVPRCELERITHKLDLLAAYVAQLSPSSVETVASVKPELHVIQGGAN
jgi:hypothetical protein